MSLWDLIYFPQSACIAVAFSTQQQVSNATKQPNHSDIIAYLYQIQRAKIKAIVKDELNSRVSCEIYFLFSPQHLSHKCPMQQSKIAIQSLSPMLYQNQRAKIK